MARDTKSRFGTGAEAWADYNRQPLGRIRQEATWHNLLPHLPELVEVKNPPRVLDAGAGSGELALKLAQRGYRVWLLDYAPAMIDLAREAAQSLPDSARQRLHFCLMSAADSSAAFPPGFFDAITCHTLIEYLPDPQDTLRTLAGLLRNGGVFSLSFVNRQSEVLRHVWSGGDPAAALATLEDGTFCARLFDVPGRAYTTEEVRRWLADLGLTEIAHYGVRAFADQVPAGRLADAAFLEALLKLELAVAHLSPYREIARYVHIVARRDRR